MVVLSDTQGNIKNKEDKEEDVAGEEGHPTKFLDKIDIGPVDKNIFFQISKNASQFCYILIEQQMSEKVCCSIRAPPIQNPGFHLKKSTFLNNGETCLMRTPNLEPTA